MLNTNTAIPNSKTVLETKDMLSNSVPPKLSRYAVWEILVMLKLQSAHTKYKA